MGKAWDGSKIAYDHELWTEAFRVLKPGGHLLAFSATRTQHRMVCAIEDAGFEIRDQIGWLYGTGFPKSLNVSVAIDKAAGAEREVIGQTRGGVRPNGGLCEGGLDEAGKMHNVTAPATPEAQQWAGWGTALKPAWEPICVARKPLIGTVAANVLEHGTGALNIDGCRVATDEVITNHSRGDASAVSKGIYQDSKAQETHQTAGQALGRWPANIIHDGSDKVLAAFAAFGESKSSDRVRNNSGGVLKYGGTNSRPSHDTFTKQTGGFSDSGTAARFFYSAKASKADRAGSKHPTVKPLSLMRYLCKLVTPPGGTVLDMFAGSGTTLQAALEEGFQAIGIERDAEYHADILRRLEMARKAAEKPAPKPKAIRVAKPKPRKPANTDTPTLFDLMMCESA